MTFGGEKARNPRRGEKGLREDRSENTKPEIAVPTACRHVDTFEPILDGEWVFYFYFFFFLISRERIVEFFSELNWEQIGDGDGENF